MAARLAAPILALALLGPPPAQAQQPGPDAKREITHLLEYLESSGCAFFRNGSWHDAREARAHLEKKNEYLSKRSLIGSTDDFIERAATGSSMSGEKYLVRCRDREAVASSVWLRSELARYRARETGAAQGERAR